MQIVLKSSAAVAFVCLLAGNSFGQSPALPELQSASQIAPPLSAADLAEEAERPQLEGIEVPTADRPALEEFTEQDADRPTFEELDGSSDDFQSSLSDQVVDVPSSTPAPQTPWKPSSISDLKISLIETDRVPVDRSISLGQFGRESAMLATSQKCLAWQAPNIRYQPLYFEDVALERYGQTLPSYRQSIRSAVHFATAFTSLGLQMLETPPRSCDYPLGYFRPGDCVPQTTQRHFFGALSLR